MTCVITVILHCYGGGPPGMSHSEKCCQNKRGCRWGVGGRPGRTTINPSHSRIWLFCRREDYLVWMRRKTSIFPPGFIQPLWIGPSWLPGNAWFQVQKWIQDAAYLFVQPSSKQLGGKANNLSGKRCKKKSDHQKAISNRTGIPTTPDPHFWLGKEGKKEGNPTFFLSTLIWWQPSYL